METMNLDRKTFIITISIQSIFHSVKQLCPQSSRQGAQEFGKGAN